VTSRWKAGRSCAPAAERPRASSITRARPGVSTQRHHPLGQPVLQPCELPVIDDLLPGRLQDIDHREPVRCRSWT